MGDEGSLPTQFSILSLHTQGFSTRRAVDFHSAHHQIRAASYHQIRAASWRLGLYRSRARKIDQTYFCFMVNLWVFEVKIPSKSDAFRHFLVLSKFMLIQYVLFTCNPAVCAGDCLASACGKCGKLKLSKSPSTFTVQHDDSAFTCSKSTNSKPKERSDEFAFSCLHRLAENQSLPIKSFCLLTCSESRCLFLTSCILS